MRTIPPNKDEWHQKSKERGLADIMKIIVFKDGSTREITGETGKYWLCGEERVRKLNRQIAEVTEAQDAGTDCRAASLCAETEKKAPAKKKAAAKKKKAAAAESKDGGMEAKGNGADGE